MLAVLVGGTMQVILPASESANQFRLVAAPAAPQLEIALGARTVLSSPGRRLQPDGYCRKPDPCAQLLDELDRGAGTGGQQLANYGFATLGNKFYRLKAEN